MITQRELLCISEAHYRGLIEQGFLESENNGVAVIIPCWNHGQTLRAAVASARDAEKIILIVQGCKDESEEVARSLVADSSERIQLVRFPINYGPSFARNVGILHARTQWVAFLDADDRYERGALTALLDAAQGKQGAVGQWLDYDADCERPIGAPKGAGLTYDAIAHRNLLIPGCYLISRQALWENNGWFNEAWRHAEDVEWFARFATWPSLNFGFVERPVVRHRVRDQYRVKYPFQNAWVEKAYARYPAILVFGQTAGDIAVVLVTHNRPQFVTSTLTSIIQQHLPPAELIIVENSCSSETDEVLTRWIAQNSAWSSRIRRLKVDFGHDYSRARMAGYALTTCPFLFFADDDDIYSAELFSRTRAAMADPRVGVAYPRMFRFKDDSRFAREWPGVRDFDEYALREGNYISNASLIRREAFDAAGGWGDCSYFYVDWRLWLRMTRLGWRGQKTDAIVYVRDHEGNIGRRRDAAAHESYIACLRDECEFALFTPFSGKRECLPEVMRGIRALLERHPTWRFYCYDNSSDPAFSAALLSFIGPIGPISPIYFLDPTPPITDRLPPESRVRAAQNIARAWAWARRNIHADFLLSIEDDIRVPDGFEDRLLDGFDEKTSAVAALYRSRFQPERYVAWMYEGPPFSMRLVDSLALPREAPAPIDMPGFGCSLIRWSLIHKHRIVFRTCAEWPDKALGVDSAFYYDLKRHGYTAKGILLDGVNHWSGNVWL